MNFKHDIVHSFAKSKYNQKNNMTSPGKYIKNLNTLSDKIG